MTIYKTYFFSLKRQQDKTYLKYKKVVQRVRNSIGLLHDPMIQDNAPQAVRL
jgi:hypothetical protein